MIGGILSWFRRVVDGAPWAEAEMPESEIELGSPSRPALTLAQIETVETAATVLATGCLPVEGDYTQTELLPTGEGYRYGAWTATARNGQLSEVVVAYYGAGGTLSLAADGMPATQREVLELVHLSARIAPGYVDQRVNALGRALRAAGKDSRMIAAQRAIWRRHTWGEVYELCATLGLTHPLSWLAVADLAADPWPPNPGRTRRRLGQLQSLFDELPPSAGGRERPWVRAKLAARLDWMRRSTQPSARQGVERTEALIGLERDRRWELRRPFPLCGVTIP